MYSRSQPYSAHILERSPLTKPSSTKKTYHVSLAVDSKKFPFKPGDSIGVIPTNDPEEVEKILTQIGETGDQKILDPRTQTLISLSDYLLKKTNISRLNSPFLKALFEKANIAHPPLFTPENKEALNIPCMIGRLNMVLAA